MKAGRSKKWLVSLFYRRPPVSGGGASCCLGDLLQKTRTVGGWETNTAGDSVPLFSLLLWSAELESVAKGHIGGVVGRRRANSNYFLSGQTVATTLCRGRSGGAKRRERASFCVSAGIARSIASSGGGGCVSAVALWLLGVGGVLFFCLKKMPVFIRGSLRMAAFGHLKHLYRERSDPSGQRWRWDAVAPCLGRPGSYLWQGWVGSMFQVTQGLEKGWRGFPFNFPF